MGGRWLDANTAERWGITTHPVLEVDEAEQVAADLHRQLSRVERSAFALALVEL
ncbi:MAG: hypothetical protein AB7Q27_01240 [Acidimicrobiia bacterium]